MGGMHPYKRFEKYLPEVRIADTIDLGQGNTPLVKSRNIGPAAGIPDLWFKLENLNPTGSYKDRFAGIAIGQSHAGGKTQCVATSSGNTGAALAAFAAAAQMPCALYVSENAPMGKLEQMLAYGADVYRVDKFTIDAEESARISQTLTECARARDLELFITAYAVSPGPMEGIKTIAYEIHEALDNVADVFVPVGGGGLFVANSRGFADLVQSGKLKQSPRMHVVQPSGNDTVAGPLRNGNTKAQPVNTSTAISGLGVGYILDGDAALNHAKTSGGQGYCIQEDEIFEVQAQLAKHEGIFVEPAGAVSLAGALDAARRGELNGAGPVVCVLTGHGFKDPDAGRKIGAVPGARTLTHDQIESTFAD